MSSCGSIICQCPANMPGNHGPCTRGSDIEGDFEDAYFDQSSLDEDEGDYILKISITRMKSWTKPPLSPKPRGRGRENRVQLG